MQGYMSRSFDESLHILVPCAKHQFSHSVQFGKLSLIIGILNTARTKSVTQRYGYVILCQNITDVIKMFIQETFFVVHQAPLAHNASPTAHNAAKPFVCQVHILSADTGMDSEVIHSLFALFNQCIFINFPTEVFHLTVYFFQGLIDGYSAHGYGAVADNPFACLMYIGSGREVHQCVSSPFAAPYRLFYFFIYRRSGGRVSDVSVDFYQKVAADNHRFAFGMIDVGREDSTSGSDFIADKFGSDMCLNSQFLAIHILADGYIFHFRCNDSCFGVCHLCDGFSCFGAIGQSDVFEAQVVQAFVVTPHFSVFRSNGRELFHISASGNPTFAHTGESFLQIDFDVRVTERTAGVIDVDGSIGCCHFLTVHDVHGRGKVYLLHTYLDIWKHRSVHVCLFCMGVCFFILFFVHHI